MSTSTLATHATAKAPTTNGEVENIEQVPKSTHPPHMESTNGSTETHHTPPKPWSLDGLHAAPVSGLDASVKHAQNAGSRATTSAHTSTATAPMTIPHGTPHHRYPRLSRPVELLRHEYDCVVIGSGYGGGVAASRMARGGQSVCVLERGEERWPGEYPATAAEAVPQLHVSGDFSTKETGGVSLDDVNPTGLYHLIFGQGQNAFVANGLGGTSLLNANVFLRMDPKTNALKVWPPELRDAAELEPCQ